MKIAELLGANGRDTQIGSDGSGAPALVRNAPSGHTACERRHRSLAEIGTKNAGWNRVDPPKRPRKLKRPSPRKLKAVRSIKPARGVLVEPPKQIKPTGTSAED